MGDDLFMFARSLSSLFGQSKSVFLMNPTNVLIRLLPCALAQNMPTMLVGRFFDGFAGSAFLSVAGGTVSDLFSGHELSAPMMVYTVRFDVLESFSCD